MESLEGVLEELQKYSKQENSDTLLLIIQLLIKYWKELDLSNHQLELIILQIQDFTILDDLDTLCHQLLKNSNDVLFMHLCLLLYLGHEFPNIHRRLSNDEWFTELFNLIDHQDEKVESISIALLSELFPYDELSYAILESIPDNLLNRLCFLIHFNHYEDNGKSNAALTLLLKIHGQFIKKRGSIRTKVLDVLLHQSLLSHRKEISLSIIHHFNRSDDTNVQNSTIDLLHTIIQRDAEYFYTNDINVLFDVTLREVMRINDSNEQLRHQYMKLLPKLIHSIPAGSPGACKTLKTQMKDKLTKISSSPLSTTSTCLLAQRILNEID